MIELPKADVQTITAELLKLLVQHGFDFNYLHKHFMFCG